MKREIKLRAFDKKSKVWRYWSVLDDCMCDLLIHGHIDKETLSEYTGLKDKNDKEIYEGDLVELPKDFLSHSFTKGVIEWKKGSFIVRWSKDNWSTVERHMEKSGIIGNIYENPDIL